MAKCSFCENQLVKGTGLLFAKKDGTAFFFCSSKCQKNSLKLKRSPFSAKWTGTYQKEKQADKKAAEKSGKTRKRRTRTRKKKKKKR
jgi:large subunit ribosomal protein L24e